MSSLNLRVLVILLFAASSAALDAQSVCSTRAMAGVWAASSQGTVFPTGNPPPIAGPGASVGLVSIGYDGQISVNLAGNIGGMISATAFLASGTITVNPDCTGQLEAVTAGGWTLSEAIVVTDEGNEVRTVAVGPFFRGKPVVWQCRWRRLTNVPQPLAQHCSVQMTRGTWTGTFDGFVITGQNPPVPAGILTRGVIDHRGHLSGQFTMSRNGEVSAGTYDGAIAEVNPDCTGRWTYALEGTDGAVPPGKVTEYFVVLDEGRQIWSLPVAGSMGIPVGVFRYQRISPVSF